MEGLIPLLRLIVGVLLAWYWINRLIRRSQLKKAARAAADAEPVTGASIPELAQLLTDPQTHTLNEHQRARLRPLVLRTDLGAEQIADQVPGVLRQRWFTLDLQHLSNDTDPHAALAFAGLRVAFYLRAARLLGWLDESLYTALTDLNARRTRECFEDWPAFSRACIEGGAQWQARGRTDIFGDHLVPDQLWPWLWVDKAGKG